MTADELGRSSFFQIDDFMVDSDEWVEVKEWRTGSGGSVIFIMAHTAPEAAGGFDVGQAVSIDGDAWTRVVEVVSEVTPNNYSSSDQCLGQGVDLYPFVKLYVRRSTRTYAGLAAQFAVSVSTLPDAGLIAFAYGPDTGDDIAFDADEATIAAAINSMTLITDQGGVSVTGSLDGSRGDLVITFNEPGQRDSISIDHHNLTVGESPVDVSLQTDNSGEDPIAPLDSVANLRVGLMGQQQ